MDKLIELLNSKRTLADLTPDELRSLLESKEIPARIYSVILTELERRLVGS